MCGDWFGVSMIVNVSTRPGAKASSEYLSNSRAIQLSFVATEVGSKRKHSISINSQNLH